MTEQHSKTKFNALSISFLIESFGITIAALAAPIFFQAAFVAPILFVLFLAFRGTKRYFKNQNLYDQLQKFFTGCAIPMFIISLITLTNGQTMIFGNIPGVGYVTVTQKISFFFAIIVGCAAAVFLILGKILEKSKNKKIEERISQGIMLFGVLVLLFFIFNLRNVVPELKPYETVFVGIFLLSVIIFANLAKSTNK